MSRRLELLFRNEEGGSATIGIDNPVEPVDPAAVAAAMEVIIEESPFTTAGGSLAEIQGARIVERTVEPIELDVE